MAFHFFSYSSDHSMCIVSVPGAYLLYQLPECMPLQHILIICIIWYKVDEQALYEGASCPAEDMQGIGVQVACGSHLSNVIPCLIDRLQHHLWLLTFFIITDGHTTKHIASWHNIVLLACKTRNTYHIPSIVVSWVSKLTFRLEGGGGH